MGGGGGRGGGGTRACAQAGAERGQAAGWLAGRLAPQSCCQSQPCRISQMAEGMGNGLSNEHGGGRNKRGFKGARLVLQGGYGSEKGRMQEGTHGGQGRRRYAGRRRWVKNGRAQAACDMVQQAAWQQRGTGAARMDHHPKAARIDAMRDAAWQAPQTRHGGTSERCRRARHRAITPAAR